MHAPTATIPQPFIDEVLEQSDIVTVIDEHVPLKKQGTSFVACCPFHHEKTPSFNVIPRKQFYYCFGCGVSGNAISFLMAHLHLGFIDALESLAARLGKTVPKVASDTFVKQKNQRPSLYALLEKVSHYYQQTLRTQGSAAEAYLVNRGVSKELIARYQLGYAPNAWQALETHFKKERQDLLATGMLVQKDDGKTYDRYRHRVMFPIQDRQGRVIGFGGRVLEADLKPKYLNSPETTLFHKGQALYGLFQVLQKPEPAQVILVVEGYMDVISLAQFGIDFAVATLGTATTAAHLQLLHKYTHKVIFCFDGDEAGRKAAWRALENSLPMVSADLELAFMFLPAEHDPDSFVRAEGRDAFLASMAKAQALNEFFFEHLTANVAIDTLAGKSQLLQQAISYLKHIPDGVYRTLLLDQLSRISRIESERIQQLMKGYALPETENKRSSLNVGRSPLRIAIALLLQYPERFSGRISPSVLEVMSEEQGIAVLHGLIAYLNQGKPVTTALLTEQWRQTPWFDSVQKLSYWDHQVPEEAIEQEFDDVIIFLNRQYVDKQIQQLLSTSRLKGLQVEQQHALQELLKKRHQLA
ncbi:MAG: DNA primase [Gammaproteobacteria bacterium]|nr:DNA primase [Gammaproteobacteria bacterium]